MPARLLIESDPPPRVLVRKMEVLAKSMSNMTLLMRQASVLLDRWVLLNFRTEGGKVGGWAPLKAGGRWRRGKFDPNAKILQDEGRLRGSFLPFSDAKNAGIGSEVPYSIFHEQGTRHLPVRRMLPVEQDVAAEIGKLFDLHIGRSAKSAGFEVQ